jgi:DNA replication licensing factor MCM6
MASAIMSDFPSDIPPSSRNTPRRPVQRGSSARPRGPPSESNGAPSDDEGYADDQIPTGVGRPKRRDRPVTRVEDRIGQIAQLNFEDFLES